MKVLLFLAIFMVAFMSVATAQITSVISKCCILQTEEPETLSYNGNATSRKEYAQTTIDNGLVTNEGYRFVNFKKSAFVIHYTGAKTIEIYDKESRNREDFKISKVVFCPPFKDAKRFKETMYFKEGGELTIWFSGCGSTVVGYSLIINGQTTSEGQTTAY
jgi:hypothetical protein